MNEPPEGMEYGGEVTVRECPIEDCGWAVPDLDFNPSFAPGVCQLHMYLRHPVFVMMTEMPVVMHIPGRGPDVSVILDGFEWAFKEHMRDHGRTPQDIDKAWEVLQRYATADSAVEAIEHESGGMLKFLFEEPEGD